MEKITQWEYILLFTKYFQSDQIKDYEIDWTRRRRTEEIKNNNF
jgi:hypothetical protein